MRMSRWILLGFSIALVTVGLTSRAASHGTGPTTEILAAAHDLPAGTTLRREDFVTRTVPNVVTVSVMGPDHLDEIIGGRIQEPMLAGDPMTWSLLQPRGKDLLYDDCRKAASEPKTAVDQVARARQTILSMERP